MRRTDAIGIFGAGPLIAGLIFLAADPKLFDHWYDWFFGPFFWMTGCVLIAAWGVLHFAQTFRSDKPAAKVAPRKPPFRE